CLAGGGRPIDGLFSAARAHACRTLARFAPDGGVRAPVSRTIQEFPGRERRPSAWPIALCRAESFIGGAGRASATLAVGQPVVESAWHGGDQGFVIALAGGTAGELDGSRQRAFDRERIRPSAREHRERTTLRRRGVGSENGKGSRLGAHRPSGRPATEVEPIHDRCENLATSRILTCGTQGKATYAQIHDLV